MMDAERSAEEMFLTEIASELAGDEWRGTNQEFYALYSEWCKKYEMRPRTAVSFGREMTPFMVKGWISKWGSNGAYGKSINLVKIRG
jgi:phage/plasmid-associated DNA primase